MESDIAQKQNSFQSAKYSRRILFWNIKNLSKHLYFNEGRYALEILTSESKSDHGIARRLKFGFVVHSGDFQVLCAAEEAIAGRGLDVHDAARAELVEDMVITLFCGMNAHSRLLQQVLGDAGADELRPRLLGIFAERDSVVYLNPLAESTGIVVSSRFRVAKALQHRVCGEDAVFDARVAVAIVVALVVAEGQRGEQLQTLLRRLRLSSLIGQWSQTRIVQRESQITMKRKYFNQQRCRSPPLSPLMTSACGQPSKRIC